MDYWICMPVSDYLCAGVSTFNLKCNMFFLNMIVDVVESMSAASAVRLSAVACKYSKYFHFKICWSVSC